ncbi:MAG: hypothetical protein HY675_16695 [Chloroflexi bacterium]|nr:hypothetical protein [Chloroflexota bacterium]
MPRPHLNPPDKLVLPQVMHELARNHPRRTVDVDLKPTNADIKSELDAWEEGIVDKRLATSPERLKDFTTWSGDIKVKRLYTPLDVQSADYLKDLGFPGAYPYTRGASH